MLSNVTPIPNVLIGIPLKTIDKFVDSKENKYWSFKSYIHEYLFNTYNNIIIYNNYTYFIKNKILIKLLFVNKVYTIQIFADLTIPFQELQQLRYYFINLF